MILQEEIPAAVCLMEMESFDGNWEAMSSDIIYEPNLQRCIGVDIRYVLYMIEKYGKSTRLINELKLVE